LITVFLPLIAGISTQTAYVLLRKCNSNPRLALYLFALYALQLIFETIVATLSISYITPSCRLEERWSSLYSNKDSGAIKRIQDRFDCCGFKTVKDRAWPFPHGRPQDGFGSDQCIKIYGRESSCLGPWRQSGQINAGLLFGVAMILFLVKAATIIFQLSNIPPTISRNWMDSFGRFPITNSEGQHSDSRTNIRRLGGRRDDLMEPQEQYHDEVDDGQPNGTQSGNNTQPRIQPSGLVGGGGGEQWREDV